MFYDSVCGLPRFEAPIGRTFSDWRSVWSATAVLNLVADHTSACVSSATAVLNLLADQTSAGVWSATVLLNLVADQTYQSKDAMMSS